MRRVAITGVGSVNALALNVPDTLAAMTEGRIGIGPLDIPDRDRLTIRIGAQVRDWPAETLFSRQELVLFDRATQFAMTAGAEAVAQAGLSLSEAGSLRAGVVMGTAGGGYTTIDDSYRAVYPQGKNRVHPFTIPRLMHNAPAAHLAMRHGLRGPAFTVSTACASSNHAMGQAFQMIRMGLADVMLTGGSEA
ncbi:MAG: beta-ACP synthase, partial [Rhodobacteraceae bacterium]|nr:beta-ACP synthase [Paracoccaceae bacterium]